MPGAGPILLEGGGRLSLAIAERLQEVGAQVERVTITEDGSAAARAQLVRASIFVLSADDDARNVDLALWAHRVRPEMPLVVRIFDDALASYLVGTVEGVTILSMSQIAAPVFADAALRVLGTARARAPGRGAERARRGRRIRSLDRVLLAALAGLALVVIPATIYYARVLELRPIDALYFVWTTVMTVGYGDISLARASDTAKVIGMLLMLAGAAFIATLFAFLTGWVVARRLDVLYGRVRIRGRGHVLIAGAGNLGFRVARRLAAGGRRVVIVERNADGHNVTSLRAEGLHVIVADATNAEVLELAGVERAGAVIALTDSDAVNLQIALLARERSDADRVVLRVISPELSAHVTQLGAGVALSPIAVAAEAFADAILNTARR